MTEPRFPHLKYSSEDLSELAIGRIEALSGIAATYALDRDRKTEAKKILDQLGKELYDALRGKTKCFIKEEVWVDEVYPD